MKSLIVLAVLGVVGLGNGQQYVWNLLKPPLTAEEVQALLISKSDQFPTYAEIPQTDFDCSSKAQAGFYADMSTGCQVFHRCDINGNMTSYLCVNTTVFNQITLVCDFWFNVDCQRSKELENFANSRLYTDQVLFDTPPANWVMPGQGINSALASQNQQAPNPNSASAVVVVVNPSSAKAAPKKAAATPKKPAPVTAKPTTTTSTAAATSEETTAAASEETTAAASGNAESTTENPDAGAIVVPPAQPIQAASASSGNSGVQASGAAVTTNNAGPARASAAATNGAQGRMTITVLGPSQQAPNP